MKLYEVRIAKRYDANLTNVAIIGLDKSKEVKEIKEKIVKSFQKVKKLNK